MLECLQGLTLRYSFVCSELFLFFKFTYLSTLYTRHGA